MDSGKPGDLNITWTFPTKRKIVGEGEGRGNRAGFGVATYQKEVVYEVDKSRQQVTYTVNYNYTPAYTVFTKEAIYQAVEQMKKNVVTPNVPVLLRHP